MRSACRHSEQGCERRFCKEPIRNMYPNKFKRASSTSSQVSLNGASGTVRENLSTASPRRRRKREPSAPAVRYRGAGAGGETTGHVDIGAMRQYTISDNGTGLDEAIDYDGLYLRMYGSRRGMRSLVVRNERALTAWRGNDSSCPLREVGDEARSSRIS